MTKKKKRKQKKKQRQISKEKQSFWEITKITFQEAMIWIVSVVVIMGLLAIIMGWPLLFTLHRSLYLVGLALGIYAVLESIIKKERGIQEKEARQAEGERIRKNRNIGIYRGFIVMAAAALIEISDYILL